ncbi:MAG: DNA-binding protein [Saprospiraceae bacterium]|nr:DNA-binding protein [Saprospiraceae bacterium]
MKHFYSVICLFLFSNILFSQTQISIDSVSTYIGQHVKVCDKVADTFRASGENSITYLNFGGKYPNHNFTVVIFAKDLVNFPFSPVEKYKNQNVCVEGMVAEYKGKPQIVAKFLEQIVIQ